ncbi:hypothetical protein GCM10010116_61060 [Microbispora rosea subsp. aerata]|nr:hypothetical protein [Microbispora rosea]GGO30487.1 hypothetical protein GCM10010116_61060 [Microbispora rosea subsp. aerata]GIH59025.1 hypothetical protein Mro02_59390 [Microbispora rosea subsp. aerata]GLJ85407.1 hypothetical protein GCM10017588_41390 [Microbispora rosea subsp. aerata]
MREITAPIPVPERKAADHRLTEGHQSEDLLKFAVRGRSRGVAYCRKTARRKDAPAFPPLRGRERFPHVFGRRLPLHCLRRRETACRAASGFYFGATEAADAELLRRLSAALTAHTHPVTPYHFADWSEALDALLALGAERPAPVVIDEFPHLARANPELPSLIQEAFRPTRDQRAKPRTRLSLYAACCSARHFHALLQVGRHRR